jgi:cell wall-associated NlpC family hydrolase
VRVAYAQIGKPYRYAGSGPNVFDCSGLVMYCYAQVGINLPHSSYMQARLGAPVSYGDLAPGDLVFFHGNGHVGMYVGGGQYIHAPHTGAYVRVNDLSVRRDFCGARRII